MVLDRAVENGFNIERAKVDAIYTGSKRSPVGTRSSSRFPHAHPRPKALPRCRYAGALRPLSAQPRTATVA
jgi:hypothetical protein